ncbi:ATP-grasp domain-containing protein [Salinicoccus carnicancri]|uniref:ATP-grasp domain-containing protein n=1 Tax=Salinicoccus carnicancri TaxID=558170 RepID=UPI001FE1034E|nr:ATP-grasp domain-containing protein [Salinicoccus carnicancri]
MDLEYIFNNSPFSSMNIYPQNTVLHLPDIHLKFLKNNNIKYNFNKAEARYLRSIDILRVDGSIIKRIVPPRYPSNALVSNRLVRDKLKTEEYLKKFNIRTPMSKIYDKDDFELAKIDAFKESRNPVVIKPLHGTLGNGVMVNVFEDRFIDNWHEMCNYLHGSREVMVQEFLRGFEARATVIEGELISITARIPPYIIGNGQDSIEELIDQKNKERMKCGVLTNYPIKKHYNMNEFLLSNNISLEHRPAKEEYVLLGSVSNFRNGGELMNITEIVPEEVKELALNTIASFPGFFSGGIDIMMESFLDTEPVVLEVNGFPVLSLAAFPTYGKQTNPSKIYMESIITMDQYINKPRYKYHIEDQERYIGNYLSFIQRRNNLLDTSHQQIFQNLL